MSSLHPEVFEASFTNATSPSTPPRKDAVRLFTAALFLTAAPVSHLLAQGTTNLPQLNVDAPAKKKAKAAKAPAKSQPQAAPPAAAAATAPPQGLPPGSYNVEAVSSAKFTGPLVDTPQTVTVVPGTIIQERGSTNLTEVLKSTPGISFNAGENAFSSSPSNFSIRGFDASGSIYVDGVRDSGSYPRDTFNVDRVEIVKGAAADNGRGSAGGYVNIVTKTPTLENFVAGDVSLGWDQYNSEVRRRATVDVNQRAGTTAVRLNGMIEDGGVAGRDIAEANAWGLAPSVAFGLGTNFRAIFSYEHVQRNDLPDWGVPAHTIKGMSRYDANAAQASRDNFYGLRSDFDDVRGDAAMARFEYDVAPGLTISNQTRWSRTDRLSRFTFPNGYDPGTDLVTTNTQFYDRENTSLSNQTNLSANIISGGIRHVISTGLELTREQSDANRQAQVANAGGSPDIFNPDPDRGPGPAFNPTERNAIHIDTVAAYLYDTVHLSRQWELVGGMRVEHYNVDIDSKDMLGGSVGPDGFSASETTVGGKAGIVYKPVKNGSFYAAYGVSSLPPGSYLSNPDISRTGGNAFPGFVPGADPVRMQNYELGVKWNFFGGRLSTAAALFRTEARVPITGREGAETTDTLKGYGRQIVEGIELTVAGNLTERWKMFGGIAIIDSERRHSAYLDQVRKNANPSDYGTVDRTSGDELAFTPNVTLSLWTTYALTNALTIGGGIRYVSDQFIGRPNDANRIIPNDPGNKLPDYWVVDLMASYKLTDNIDLRFNVDNVFDETYAVSTNWSAQRVFLGAPRTFRVGTAFKF